MALSNDDAAEAFESLAQGLRGAGYSWVITQVEEKLALGKVRPRKLGGREANKPEAAVYFGFPTETLPPRKGSALFAVSEQYSPSERLRVLIDAMELAVPAVARVAMASLLSLHEYGAQSECEFAPEAEVSEEFTLTVGEVEARLVACDRLSALLRELKAEVPSAD